MLSVGVIGAGRRFERVYAPLIRELPDLRLVALCGRNRERTTTVARHHDATAVASVAALLDIREVGLVIACVHWRENAAVYAEIAQSDKPALLETPLGETFAEASEVADALAHRSAPTTIAEQYPHRPVEIVKQQLIAAGAFGEVFHAFNDGAGHEYHGASLIRAYLGRERRLMRVAAFRRDVPLAPHRFHHNVFFDGERIEHALLEFDGDRTATHHWSWLAYESPIRARRIAGFHGTLGASWGEECIAFQSMEDDAVPLRLERRTRVVEGVEVPYEVAALRGTERLAAWRNPFPDVALHEELLATATLLRSAADSAEDPGLPSAYPPDQALEDHRVAAAITCAAESRKPAFSPTSDCSRAT